MVAVSETISLYCLWGVASEETTAFKVYPSELDRAQLIVKSLLPAGMPLVSAGTEGSVAVWRDDEGRIRCQFSRFRQVVNQRIFSSVEPALEWVDHWWPKMSKQY